MEAIEQKQRFSKLRITYFFVVVTALAGISSYGYYIYKTYRDAKLYLPQPQVERLIKDLRRYRGQTRKFPTTFTEINELLWHTTPAPNYGSDGRRARTRNYYYYYTRVNAETCAFWALPQGPQRQVAASYFVVIAPDWVRGWQGEALTDETITRLPAVPALGELAELRLYELPMRALSVGHLGISKQ